MGRNEKDPDLELISKYNNYLMEQYNKFLVKDMKNGDIYAALFSNKYNSLRDIEFTKTDLVFDSCILSDFSLIGPDLLGTATLHSIINGLTLLPAIFFYAMMTNEFKPTKIITLLDNVRLSLYGTNESILLLNLVVLFGFLFNFLSTYTVSFNLGKPGDKSKVK
jgi:hypothetical protein